MGCMTIFCELTNLARLSVDLPVEFMGVYNMADNVVWGVCGHPCGGDGQHFAEHPSGCRWSSCVRMDSAPAPHALSQSCEALMDLALPATVGSQSCDLKESPSDQWIRSQPSR